MKLINHKAEELRTDRAVHAEVLDEIPMDLKPLLKEPDDNIVVTRHELLKLCIEADRALDGDSNDDEHDALYELRQYLSCFLEDESRRLTLPHWTVRQPC